MLLSSIVTWMSGALATAPSTDDWSSHSGLDVIYRDVAIIGGGSTGTYTAVRLRDHNYSVAVIEPKHQLGGHAETYTAPNGWTIDIGVIVFSNTSTVKDYFARFEVPIVAIKSGPWTPERYIDFTTGQRVNDYVAPDQAAFADGLANYAEQLHKYPGLLNNQFNITYPIPADSDLLLPFGDFARKYNLTGAMRVILQSNQGYVPLLNVTTLFMLKYLNQEQLDSYASSFYTTVRHNIQELYQKAGAFLGADNVYLNSSVIAMTRSDKKSKILIRTPTGNKLIIAKRVVVTAPPTLSNLQSANMDLSNKESSLFSQFFSNGYYTGVMTNTGFPRNFSAQAIGPNSTNFNAPRFPSIYHLTENAGAPGYIQVYYGTPRPVSNAEAQANIIETVQRVQRAQDLPITTPKFEIFSSHAPFNLMVSNDAIRDRFYEKLFALQGEKGTFWNGAAWNSQDSSVLWKFTDDWLMPRLLTSLEHGG